MKYSIIILFLLFKVGYCQNQNFLKIAKNDLKEIEITREDFYNDGSLWGYMNGGADLYLDYGFDMLCVQEVKLQEENLKIEIFNMRDADAAFGIYSVRHYKCDNTRKDSIFSCISKYQYQFVINNYCVSIINNTGNKTASQLSQKIADVLVNKLEIKKYKYPGFLNSPLIIDNLNMSELFYSPLGLANAYEDWEELFSDSDKYFILKTSLNFKGEEFTILQVIMAETNLNTILKHYEFDSGIRIEDGSIESDNSNSVYIKRVERDKYLYIECEKNNSRLNDLIGQLF